MASRKTRSPSRREMLQRQKRARVIRIGLLALALITVGFWGWPTVKWGMDYFLGSCESYRVRAIQVVGLERLDSDEIIKKSGINNGTPLFQIDLKEIGERLRTHPWIHTATAVRRLPDTIELRIKERKPVAFLNTGIIWTVTADSILLPLENFNQSWDMPLLRAQNTSSLIEGDSLRDLRACALLAQLITMRQHTPRLWRDLSELFWRHNEMWAILQKGNVEVRLGSGVEEIRLKSLERLLAQLEAQHKLDNVESIDLRFMRRLIVQYRSAESFRNKSDTKTLFLSEQSLLSGRERYSMEHG